MNNPIQEGQQLIIARRAEIAAIDAHLNALLPESIALLQAIAEHDTSAEVVITDHATLQSAIEQAAQVKAIVKQIEDFRTRMVKPLNAQAAEINGFFKPKTDVFNTFERKVKDAINVYSLDQARQAREAEARAQAAARKAAEELAERAAKHAAAGRVEMAEELQAQASNVIPLPVAAPAAAKVSGASQRTTWHAEVYDEAALIRAVADGKAPSNVIEVNFKVLNSLAKASKEHLTYIPGVRAVSKTDTALRAA